MKNTTLKQTKSYKISLNFGYNQTSCGGDSDVCFSLQKNLTIYQFRNLFMQQRQYKVFLSTGQ